MGAALTRIDAPLKEHDHGTPKSGQGHSTGLVQPGYPGVLPAEMEETVMYWLIALLALCVFAIGVIVGARCEESALRYREQRLYLDRRRVNAQMRALHAHNEVNKLIGYAQNELRENALAQAQDMPFVVEPQFEHVTIPSQRNDTKQHRAQSAVN